MYKQENNMAKQTKTGKAFEYAILCEFYNRLHTITTVSIIENAPYRTAKSYFDAAEEKEQEAYSIVASSAVNFLIDIEPRLSYGIESGDILQLELVTDSAGQAGDVRDVLAIRSLQKWEIGISAKNNHRAVKHSRLSPTINFGKKWLGITCSQGYFEEINKIFSILEEKVKENPKVLWSSIENMHDVIYVPLLESFKKELLRLDRENPDIVPQRLVEYLIGNKDFYKVIKKDTEVEIQIYNIHGTLNQSLGKIKPKAKVEKLKLPTRLIEVVFKKDSKTTLIVSLDEGWQISFRIHNANSVIETSLKFDVNLVSAPHTLFTQHIFLKREE